MGKAERLRLRLQLRLPVGDSVERKKDDLLST
jgi:hypothetical protein